MYVNSVQRFDPIGSLSSTHQIRYSVNIHSETDYSFSDFAIQPMPASVPLGETALFTCAGEGIAPLWTINGQPDNVPASKERGVNVTYDNEYAHAGASVVSLKSNLTIPGTVENDNVSIQCALLLASNAVYSPVVYSPVVYLTVLGKLCMVNVMYCCFALYIVNLAIELCECVLEPVVVIFVRLFCEHLYGRCCHRTFIVLSNTHDITVNK